MTSICINHLYHLHAVIYHGPRVLNHSNIEGSLSSFRLAFCTAIVRTFESWCGAFDAVHLRDSVQGDHGQRSRCVRFSLISRFFDGSLVSASTSQPHNKKKPVKSVGQRLNFYINRMIMQYAILSHLHTRLYSMLSCHKHTNCDKPTLNF